jgi:hypothetical protein
MWSATSAPLRVGSLSLLLPFLILLVQNGTATYPRLEGQMKLRREVKEVGRLEGGSRIKKGIDTPQHACFVSLPFERHGHDPWIPDYRICKSCKVGKQDQTKGHHCHTGYERVADTSIGWIVSMSRRQELFDTDQNHHTRDHAKQDSKDDFVHRAGQDKPSKDGRDWFADSTEDSPQERLRAIARGIIDGHGDTKSFGDVVQRNGNSQNAADGRVVKSGDKGSQSFGKVVKGNGDCSVHRHEHELFLVLFLDSLLLLFLGTFLGLLVLEPRFKVRGVGIASGRVGCVFCRTAILSALLHSFGHGMNIFQNTHSIFSTSAVMGGARGFVVQVTGTLVALATQISNFRVLGLVRNIMAGGVLVFKTFGAFIIIFLDHGR